MEKTEIQILISLGLYRVGIINITVIHLYILSHWKFPLQGAVTSCDNNAFFWTISWEACLRLLRRCLSLFSEICARWFAWFVFLLSFLHFLIIDLLGRGYYTMHIPLLMKTFWCWDPCFHTFKEPVCKSFCRTLHCEFSWKFVLLLFPFLLPVLHYKFLIQFQQPLSQFPRTTSRSSSMSSSSTPRLKLFAISTMALLNFITSTSLANHLSHGRISWVSLPPYSIRILLGDITLNQSKGLDAVIVIILPECINVFRSCSNSMGKGPSQGVGLKSCCASWIHWVEQRGGIWRNPTLTLGWRLPIRGGHLRTSSKISKILKGILVSKQDSSVSLA